MKKLIGKSSAVTKKRPSMALWGSSVRSRSRPPLLSIPNTVEAVEIKGDWELLPAVQMREGKPTLSRVLLRKSPVKFESGLKPRKSGKASA